MMTTTQLNARLDKKLKASGDAALALIGLSPTQAVRALWEKAARRGADLEEVAALLSPAPRQKAPGASRQDDAVRQGWDFMEKAYDFLGIDASTVRDYPEDEMLEAALEERFAERGLA